MSDTDMVEYLSHCFFEPARPRPSIETLLHAFLPFTHIDHTHADATNFFACAADGERLARECFGDDLVWVPYRRPGFGLAREVALAVRAHPQASLVILAKHGLITWGETDEDCYTSTLATIERARVFVERRLSGQAFGGAGVRASKASENAETQFPQAPAAAGARVETLPGEARREVAASILPTLRGLVSAGKRMILRFEDAPDVLEFASSQDAPRLVQIGAACPDHLVHTKPWPLLVDWAPDQGAEALAEALRTGVASYRARYERYLEENARQDLDPDAAQPVYRSESLAVDTAPRVDPHSRGWDGDDRQRPGMADVSAQLYHRAVAVMRGAEACGGFISLTDAESYAVEYWPLEQYKLTLAPPEREFARQVALVTGAAGGIGSAVCYRLARDGAQIVATDIDLEGAEQVAQDLCRQYGAGRAVAVRMDVTNEESVRAAFAAAALAFGGIDVVVNNAGLASSAPIAETTLAEWNKNLGVLATGYFLTAREAFRLFTQQGRGGNLVFIASKNALVAGKNASAYSTAKAAELHLARCLAEEGGALGIRVNVVNPDAVLAGSRIWEQFLAGRARRHLWHRARATGRTLSQAHDAGRQYFAGRYCRGRCLLCFAHALQQKYGQHPQCGWRCACRLPTLRKRHHL